ncbi:MAG: flavodoxin domain-containing protein [Comamonas sp.]
MSTLKLKILVGTQSDTAYGVAQAIETQFAGQLPCIEVIRLDEKSTLALFENTPEVLHLICSSTFGSGDVPDNARALYTDFERDPRTLSEVRYGVIALGDTFYRETFAMGGERFDDKLRERGATRLGEILRMDASEGEDPDEIGVDWAREWLAAHAAPHTA